MAAKRRRRAMKPGECRKTKNGQPYCMTRNGVRFKKQSGAGSPKGKRRKSSSSSKGKTCIKFQRVRVKGKRGTERRCKEYN